MEPDWVEHAIWWHVLPLSFVGAEGDGVGVALTHRLGRVVDWFDYAVELGASGVALGPVFASGTHGYDTTDHFRIDPRLGDDADFRALVAAAHDRGLRVLLDGVFNHVGREFPAFVAAEAGGPEAAWFRRADDGGWATFEGHDMLVALNHDEPAVAEHVVAVMGHWLAAGADGWRLDAAYAVPPAFWARVLPQVRERFPDVYVVGEVIHGEYADIVEGGGGGGVTP
jgi:cyclomaltodextrinase